VRKENQSELWYISRKEHNPCQNPWYANTPRPARRF
jgi:hypothetical protein